MAFNFFTLLLSPPPLLMAQPAIYSFSDEAPVASPICFSPSSLLQSISLLMSLSLSLSSRLYGHLVISMLQPPSSHMPWSTVLRGGGLGGAHLRCCSIADNGRHVGACRRPFLHGGRTSTNNYFHGGSRCKQIYLDLLMKMVPSIPDESARIVDMHFRAKTETLQVDLSQTKPYFEVTTLDSYS